MLDDDGYLVLGCVVCEAEDYRLCAEILEPLNVALGARGGVSGADD